MTARSGVQVLYRLLSRQVSSAEGRGQGGENAFDVLDPDGPGQHDAPDVVVGGVETGDGLAVPQDSLLAVGGHATHGVFVEQRA